MSYFSCCLGLVKKNICYIDKGLPDNFKFVLPTKERLVVGLDVSTSCIGTTFTNADMSFFLLIDFKNMNESKDTFFLNYRRFMSRILKDVKIGLSITEKPVPSKWANSGNVLKDFLGRVSVMQQDISAFENCVKDGIYPQTWKSKVVDKSKGKNRHKSKLCIATDLCDIVPCLSKYVCETIASDFDSFDALGIILGYLKSHTTTIGEETIRVVKGKNVQLRNFTAFFFRFPLDKLSSVSSEDLGYLGASYHNEGSIERFYNSEYSLIENLVMTSESFTCSGITIIDKSICLRLDCYFKQKFLPDYGYFCVVIRNSSISKKLLDINKSSCNYMSFLRG